MKKGVSLDAARAAKQPAAELFTPLVGEEVAVGIMRADDNGFGLKINLTSPPHEGLALPDEVLGVPVQVEVVGKIRKR